MTIVYWSDMCAVQNFRSCKNIYVVDGVSCTITFVAVSRYVALRGVLLKEFEAVLATSGVKVQYQSIRRHGG